MNDINKKLRAGIVCASIASSALFWAGNAAADIPLTDPSKTDGWLVSISGQVDAYLSWAFGHTTNLTGQGLPSDPTNPNSSPNILVGPQFGVSGNPTPAGAVADPINDTKLSSPRIRGGFASTILGFNVVKQVNDFLKVTFKFGLWAGIQNGTSGATPGYRSQNDAASVDWRDQYVELETPWGLVWGGRRLGLFNRGGMRMDWFLVHQHGVGNPCTVDSNGTASCGNTGVGSMFPNRNAQIGYATPLAAGFQFNIAMFDPSAINTDWVRTPAPRLEAEATFHREFGGTDELNIWANGLAQPIGRVKEAVPDAPTAFAGVPADAVREVWGVGGGAWGRTHGFAIGGTAWAGPGLGTATAFSNTAIDDHGTLRQHFGYLGAANYRLGDFELGGSYGSSNCIETDWDKSPLNPLHESVIKHVNGTALNVAYHVGPIVFSVDGMNIHYLWARGETQTANVVSAGLLGAF